MKKTRDEQSADAISLAKPLSGFEGDSGSPITEKFFVFSQLTITTEFEAPVIMNKEWSEFYV